MGVVGSGLRLHVHQRYAGLMQPFDITVTCWSRPSGPFALPIVSNGFLELSILRTSPSRPRMKVCEGLQHP